jgi:Fe-S cluster assembly protein SufD
MTTEPSAELTAAVGSGGESDADTDANASVNTENEAVAGAAPSADGHAPHVEPYLQDFERFIVTRSGTEPPQFTELRHRAIAVFARNGFPNVKLEEWRFTNVETLEETEFRLAQPAADAADAADASAGRTETTRATEAPSFTVRGIAAQDVAPHLLPDAHNLVFIDGHYAPELSKLGDLPAGAIAISLATALASAPPAASAPETAPALQTVTARYGALADLEHQHFVALNTAFATDGGFVHIAPGTVVEPAIHLLFIATDAPEGTPRRVSYPRNLVVAGEGARVTVVETYVGHGAYFTCGVTEIDVGRDAAVDHYRIQSESAEAFHMATLQLDQHDGSTFASHAISSGGHIARYDANAYLGGEGVHTTLNGLYLARGTQHIDNHMWVEHARPGGTSHELYKGILEGEASAVFTGRILVREGAQETDAVQSNRNLLLSEGALVNSNPQLEIYADDVRCTHGSTVGQLDEESIFYLRSRGIGEEAARSLLIYAFASDIVAGVKVDAVRAGLEQLLFDRLPRGEVVAEVI